MSAPGLVAEREHGAATIERHPDGGWVAECHDCPWRSEPCATDLLAEKAWYGHAGPVPAASRTQLQAAGR